MNRETLLQILDLARWAPSGDNTQPWRFEIVPDSQIAIHGFDTREHVIYDFDGHASHMAHGALLETLRLAATRFGLKTAWSIRNGCPDSAPIYDVTLELADIPEDPLVPFIETRCVQRRPMRTTPLSAVQKDAMIAAIGDDFSIRFFETFEDRLAVARLLWKNAHIRLTCPEALHVHREIIEWNARYSTDRIPDQAVGADPLTVRLMPWAMQSWERMDFLNRYLGGTIVPRLQMDFIPALACASHILLVAEQKPAGLADYLKAGMALQRLWLTATEAGLFLQPEMTPVIFRWYARSGREFSALPEIAREAQDLAECFEKLAAVGQEVNFSFFCRVGQSSPPRSRSIRKSLGDLFVKEQHL